MVVVVVVLLAAESLSTGNADFDEEEDEDVDEDEEEEDDEVITLLEVILFKAGTTEDETSPDGKWGSLLCDGGLRFNCSTAAGWPVPNWLSLHCVMGPLDNEENDVDDEWKLAPDEFCNCVVSRTADTANFALAESKVRWDEEWLDDDVECWSGV